MITTFISCIFILALQGVILFYLLKLPLSLWFDATLTSAILSGVLLCVQVVLSGSIYDLFFMVDFEEMEDAENKKNGSEKKSGSVVQDDREILVPTEEKSGLENPSCIGNGKSWLENPSCRRNGESGSENPSCSGNGESGLENPSYIGNGESGSENPSYRGSDGESGLENPSCIGNGKSWLENPSCRGSEEKSGIEEDRSRFREEIRGFVEGILTGMGVKSRVVICGDPHPFILSYTGLTGGSRLVVSSGLAKMLKKSELEALVKREAFLLKNSGTKIFSIATFLPFVILSLSNWMVETARELRKHRGTGASFLAGGILFYVYRASEFFLLFISRARQAAAVKSIPPENRKTLAQALEKAARGFCEPIKMGPPFRKLIYQSLRYFFPFDPVRVRNVLMWEKFLGKETSVLKLFGRLRKTNPFFRLNGIFSSHPEDIAGYAENTGSTEPMPWSEKELNRDLKMLSLPYVMTLVGAVVSFTIKGYFGIPLILLGLSLAILTIYFIRSEKKNTSTDLENSQRLKITGQMGDRYFGDNFEAPYYFVKREDNYIPLILRQMGRDEEPMFFLTGDKVEADGVIRAHEMPYMEVRSLVVEEGKVRGIVSLNLWYRALLAVGIMALGAMIIVVQIMGMR